MLFHAARGDAREAVYRLKEFYQQAAKGGYLATGAYLRRGQLQDAFVAWRGDYGQFRRLGSVLGRARRRRGAYFVEHWRTWRVVTSRRRQMLRAGRHAAWCAKDRALSLLHARRSLAIVSGEHGRLATRTRTRRELRCWRAAALQCAVLSPSGRRARRSALPSAGCLGARRGAEKQSRARVPGRVTRRTGGARSVTSGDDLGWRRCESRDERTATRPKNEFATTSDAPRRHTPA